MRRTRTTGFMREFFGESRILNDNLIMPVFVDENLDGRRPIDSMPGIYRHGLDELHSYLSGLSEVGIKYVLLFGIPSRKDSSGSSAYDGNGVVQQALRIASEVEDMMAIPDLCMCEYTDSGHCGILSGQTVDNDLTLDSYGKIAVSYAASGAGMIAPSGMMDGQVAAIREALDKEGFEQVSILAYSAKYASTLYSPFREAADSTPSFGDRKSYQMDPANMYQALREIELDIEEGADMVMVKPALFYLDVLAMAKETFRFPTAAYSVSAEYSMLLNAVGRGIVPQGAITEAVASIFRAGADKVITYFAEMLASGNLSD
ncbi:MAG: porphobilinogen synthase [Candidatus Thermoplasmatota archaeon]|nr:porphobilinogen synthase [Candidatus Thermoplasmatota archaeon]